MGGKESKNGLKSVDKSKEEDGIRWRDAFTGPVKFPGCGQRTHASENGKTTALARVKGGRAFIMLLGEKAGYKEKDERTTRTEDPGSLEGDQRRYDKKTGQGSDNAFKWPCLGRVASYLFKL